MRIQQRFEGLLAYSRLLALIPVVFLLLDAAGSFIYGADILVRTAGGDFGEPSKVGGRLGIFLIVMDTFLVGATLMIAAFGFYELFVLRRERTMHKYWLPNWLQMRDLEDLKARVVSMLILVAAITFVDLLVEARGPRNILFLGAGIAVIIIALSAFLRFGRKPRTADDADDAGRAADHPAPSNPAGDQGQSPAGQLRRPGRSKTPGLLERRHRGLRQPAGQVQGRDQRRRGLRQASEGQVQGRDQRRRRAVRRH
ncbi:MAG TPA: YqhA family protein [Streptosporangiaceae bacterium]|nr:YqhA family protein [Streptosporangiaceae bacterium]